MLDKSDENIAKLAKNKNIDIFVDGSDNYDIDTEKLKRYVDIELRILYLPNWEY